MAPGLRSLCLERSFCRCAGDLLLAVPCSAFKRHVTTLCVQFVLRSLASGKATTFYNDEFRCPIFVGDICSIVSEILGSKATFGQDSAHRQAAPLRLRIIDLHRCQQQQQQQQQQQHGLCGA